MNDINEIKDDLSVLWNYLCLDTKPKKSECIIGLGSILTLIPKRSAELYKEGLGEYMIFSGNCGKGTVGVLNITEAERFKNIAVEEGVPEDKIIMEPDATTTYENYKFIKKVLEEKNLNPNSFLILGKPYQERRALAIAEVEFPNKEFTVAGFNMSLEEYIDFAEKDELMKVEDVVNEMVGEVGIISIAPRYGLQSYQEIPEEVMESYNRIIEAGYNQYVYSEERIKKVIQKLVDKRTKLVYNIE